MVSFLMNFISFKLILEWNDVGQSYDLKGTSLNTYKSLETDGPGQWNDDEVLKRLDDVMYNARQYGIKLLISLHSYNILENKGDFYGKWYGTGYFYTDSNAINYFKQRIAHILSHVNPHNGKPWSQCSEYIFAFEAQNEAMNGVSSFSVFCFLRQIETIFLRTNHFFASMVLPGNVKWQLPFVVT